MNKRKIKVESKKIANSFKYAIEGFKTSFKTERNMKIHILMTILVIILGYIFKISTIEWIICILLCGLVITAELINTSIETIVDMITPYKNEKAKTAKDIAASAVFVIAITSAIIGIIIFFPKIL